MTDSLTPIEVAPYSRDFVTNVIRHVTRWSARSEVGDKAHLVYLDNYLKNLEVKTVVLETDYVDRHYLEDYSEYYARCFQSLPKKCVRMHFFSSSFSEEDFIDAVENRKHRFIQRNLAADGTYAGFVVIKPLPVTCIARMCLRPYEFDSTVAIVRKRVNVSLCGLQLSLMTAAFLEQDKVVSACATSAIWALLNASQTFNNDTLPSPSAITKSALGTDSNGARVFPAAAGLRVEHICRGLKAYGLEPTVVDKVDYKAEDFVEKTKAILAAYIPSGMPVLIGGTVSELGRKGSTNVLGDHLICALGIRGNKLVSLCEPSDIERIYVHDDRYGPYVSIGQDPKKPGSFLFELRQTDENGRTSMVRKERFEPNVLILGLYHKIRIDFDYVYNVAAGLLEVVQLAVKNIPEIGMLEEFIEFSACTFQISLCMTSNLKSEFLEPSNAFCSFNGSGERSSLLFENFPKYIWRARFVSGGLTFSDIYIDATGVPQGDLIVGCIAYSEIADRLWKAMAKFVDSDFYKNVVSDLGQGVPNVLGCVTRFFDSFEDNYLDAYYGCLRFPSRKFRESELDIRGNQVKRSTDLVKIVRGTPANRTIDSLNSGSVYIWVIDRLGDLILGEEDQQEGKSLGHPSLTEGGLARLAGELRWSDVRRCWEINTKSGTYSSHLKNDRVRSSAYLNSVLAYNLMGCDVKIEKYKKVVG